MAFRAPRQTSTEELEEKTWYFFRETTGKPLEHPKNPEFKTDGHCASQTPPNPLQNTPGSVAKVSGLRMRWAMVCAELCGSQFTHAHTTTTRWLDLTNGQERLVRERLCIRYFEVLGQAAPVTVAYCGQLTH